MKTPLIRLWLLVCLLAILLNACQKEISHNKVSSDGESQIRATGVVADDPAAIAKVPMIVSSEFYKSMNDGVSARGGLSPGKDSDKDGIPDSKDACPTQKETRNGYQDTDGCPDTAPPPASTDTDGDGIADTADGCITQVETFNGYQDTDGCPDTVPDTDADGIIDTQDGCPTEKEIVNGYEDMDGCPDTPPVVIPPTTLPAGYSLLMPPVQNQGGEGACAAFATAYAARSAEQFYRTNASGYNLGSNIFSPEFLYNQTKISDCGSGTGLTTALDFMISKGVCTWQSMPYSSSNGCSVMPTSSQTSEAGNYKIASYSKIPVSDIAAIKTMIVNKHPVIITIATDQSFWNAQPGFIWKTYSSAPGISHALVICGYDDAKHAFKVMNSWGTAWADAGYSWIDYDFLPQASFYYSYVIS